MVFAAATGFPLASLAFLHLSLPCVSLLPAFVSFSLACQTTSCARRRNTGRASECDPSSQTERFVPSYSTHIYVKMIEDRSGQSCPDPSRRKYSQQPEAPEFSGQFQFQIFYQAMCQRMHLDFSKNIGDNVTGWKRKRQRKQSEPPLKKPVSPPPPPHQ